MKLYDKELIVFGNLPEYKTLEKIAHFSCVETSQEPSRFHLYVSQILQYAARYGLRGNLYKKWIACLLINDENMYSLDCERSVCQNAALRNFALHDIALIRKLYFYDFSDVRQSEERDSFLSLFSFSDGKISKPSGLNAASEYLCGQLDKTIDDEGFLTALSDFYRDKGVGMFCAYPAFCISEGGEAVLSPVEKYSDVKFTDLWGYEIQKQQLVENTDAFVSGNPANNVLLFGDSGTGKSTCIKALLNEYYDKGLRIIEVNKYQFCHLKTLAQRLKGRNYFFIFYLDDLSFEDNETEYKYLKAVIEGGIEPIPGNILIYATSNRRHLIRETWSDRSDMDDDIHHSDTVQEKISLADRFGVAICFSKPLQKEYFEIVLHLARQKGISTDREELLRLAKIWGAEHGGLSGRSARQFIDYMLGAGNQK